MCLRGFSSRRGCLASILVWPGQTRVCITKPAEVHQVARYSLRGKYPRGIGENITACNAGELDAHTAIFRRSQPHQLDSTMDTFRTILRLQVRDTPDSSQR